MATVLSFPLLAPAPVALSDQLPAGRLVELSAASAGAQMTLATSCLRRAQERGETTAWVQREGGSLYPPDLHDSGVDLASLVIVQVPTRASRERSPAVAHALGKAAELLLRSGGFGLVVLDLVDRERGASMRFDLAFQGRLLGLAREHNATLVLLTEGGAQSFGPLVSLCIEPQRTRVARGVFEIEPRVRKDKSGLLSPLTKDRYRGPWGLS